MNQIWAFAVFAAVLAVTPGLDTMLVIRTAATNGRRAGLAAVIGVALGCLMWAVASALGVTAVLSASQVAFDALRIAGAAYLCWLGASALWQARRSPAPAVAAVTEVGTYHGTDVSGFPGTGDGVAAGKGGVVRGLRVGFTTNLLNPKVGVFYLSVIPQFLPAGMNPLSGSLILAGIHMAAGLIWLSLVVLVVHRARAWFNRPTVRRRLQQFAGLAFLGFGLRLALTPDLR